MPTTIPSIESLQRAVLLTEQIEQLQAELNRIFGGSGGKVSTAPAAATPQAAKPGRKKGKMSAAGRASIVAAQKARWAKIKAAKAPSPALIGKIAKIEAAAPKAKKKVKRKISPEARARMVAGAKARWAAQTKVTGVRNAQARWKIAAAGQPKFSIL